MVQFAVGNLVVVTELIENLTGIKSSTHSLCEILVVGKEDLYLKTTGSNNAIYNSRFFISSKKMCKCIEKKEETVFHDILNPKIGDLVMNLPSKYSKDKKVIGILEEIKHLAGRHKTAKIREGSKLHNVTYQDLIVL
jgi:hypothetical protein